MRSFKAKETRRGSCCTGCGLPPRPSGFTEATLRPGSEEIAQDSQRRDLRPGSEGACTELPKHASFFKERRRTSRSAWRRLHEEVSEHPPRRMR